MLDLLHRVPERELVPLVVALCGMLTGIVISISTVVAVQWRKNRRDELNADLKHAMLERGMSAEEIERVIRATPGDDAIPVNSFAPAGVRSRARWRGCGWSKPAV